MRISDWSSDVCSSDLTLVVNLGILQSSGTLYPVPVRITDLVENGRKPNTHPESKSSKDDVFVKRFHLFDPEIGKADTSTTGTDGELVPRFLRLAKRIELRINTQEAQADRLYVPVLSIRYSDVSV